MNFPHFGALFLGPFMMLSAFLGLGGHHIATSTSLTASTTAGWNWNKPEATSTKNVMDPKDYNGKKWQYPVATSTSSTALTLATLSATSGPIGTQVTLTGTGFTSASLVHFGGGVVKDSVVASNGTSITFTVPSSVGPYCAPRMMCAMYLELVRPGDYKVSVENPNTVNTDASATSDVLVFTVTSTSSVSNQITISGIDAAPTLTEGVVGTWFVHATSPSTLSGDLHYSVVWGDEATPSLFSIRANDATTISSSAIFTHVYEVAGTYTPTFTVTDDAGHTATASATVVVKPVY